MAFVLSLPQGLNLPIPPTAVPPDRREFIDANNQLQNARYINPVTLDFELNDNGTFVGENIINQQVYLAILTTYNTACQSNLGSKLKSVRVITPDIVLKITNIITSALSDLINSNLIALGAINVSVPYPNSINISFTWVNVATNAKNIFNLPTPNTGS